MLSINTARKLDPSRTATIRQAYERAITSRFRRLRRDIVASIIDKDCFGLQPGLLILRAAEPRQFDFPRSEDKVKAFMEWLQQQVDEGILEVTERDNTGRIVGSSEWQDLYIRTTAERAVIQATNAMTAAGVTAPLIVSNPFNQPIFADRLGLLYTRQFTLLKGITEAMSSGIANELTLGMAQGLNPKVIARNIAKKVDGIGITRARVLAQTEIIRSHSESTLNVYESAGLEEVEVEAEWSTAKDGRVCPTCASREGKIYSLKEARGLIPAHPRCRCNWRPWTKAIAEAEERRKVRRAA